MTFVKPVVEFLKIEYENIVAGSNCGDTETKCIDATGSGEWCGGPESFSHGGCEDTAPLFGNE